jgi:hypothetical protein
MNTQIYIGKVVKLTRNEPQDLESFNTSPHWDGKTV